jgi:tRNA(Ile)-lysidine synthase
VDPVARLEAELRQHIDGWPQARLLLACSGGVDSRVLLELLARLRRQRRFELRVVHVNHHLQPAAAGFARGVRQACRELAVPCRVRHAHGVARRGESVEARAREARYALLASELRAGEVLLTAQHCDDQMETVLLQLIRGAGVEGLAAMPASAAFGRGQLLRPLLAWRRADLEAIARRWELGFVDDPSNRDTRFDRNFLRQEIIPRLSARWPALATTVARSAGHVAEAAQLAKVLAAQDLPLVMKDGALEIASLTALSAARQRGIVRAWLRSCGLALPDQIHLQRILQELIGARPDRHPQVQWPGGAAWRERGMLCAAATLPRRAARKPGPELSITWDWRAGNCHDLAWQPDSQGPIDGSRLPPRIELRFRAGGERLRPCARSARRPLKDLLREAAVPERSRNAVPLIFTPAGLLAVGARWVNFDHPAVRSGALEPGRFIAVASG